ncbi:glycosyltransferase family 2 protein [Actinomycetaceae bacterium TAE3-ERU4]|nr:glycosyltransferase family 2 protein [Actinomycetaceae bacterium TAE3-ERU4]
MDVSFTDTWIVMPLYNEASVIGSVIGEILPVFPNILCIDDGSKDNSAQVALEAGAHVTTHPINLGQGAAIQTGIEYVLKQTDAKYLITFDADGQHRLADAQAMRERAATEDLAIIFGSRFLGAPVECGWLKRFALQAAAAFTRLRGGLNLTDTHNGLRLIRRDAFSQIKITQHRMAHASELVNQLAETNLPYAEQSVHIRYSDYSRSKGQSSLNSVNIVIDLLIK